MKSLWFKNVYVADILSGRKRDTIRRNTGRVPKVGETVFFQVGPRDPFAFAKITEVNSIDLNALSGDRMLAIMEMYDDTSNLVCIKFELIDEPKSS